MRLKQTGALLLASAMMIGTIGMMSPTEVKAAEASYTLTAPAETTLNSDGTAKELANGLKVEGSLPDGKKVTVTATSADSWMLSAEGKSTKIGYGLYAAINATETTTSWDFSKAEATEGTTKSVYSKINTTHYEAADPGDYSDTIIFTGSVENATTATLTEAEVKAKVDAVDDTLMSTSHFVSPTSIRTNYGSFSKMVAGATFTDNEDGTYTFLKAGKEPMPDTTIVVTITDGEVVSVTVSGQINTSFEPAN